MTARAACLLNGPPGEHGGPGGEVDYVTAANSNGISPARKARRAVHLHRITFGDRVSPKHRDRVIVIQSRSERHLADIPRCPHGLAWPRRRDARQFAHHLRLAPTPGRPAPSSPARPRSTSSSGSCRSAGGFFERACRSTMRTDIIARIRTQETRGGTGRRLCRLLADTKVLRLAWYRHESPSDLARRRGRCVIIVARQTPTRFTTAIGPSVDWTGLAIGRWAERRDRLEDLPYAPRLGGAVPRRGREDRGRASSGCRSGWRSGPDRCSVPVSTRSRRASVSAGTWALLGAGMRRAPNLGQRSPTRAPCRCTRYRRLTFMAGAVLQVTVAWPGLQGEAPGGLLACSMTSRPAPGHIIWLRRPMARMRPNTDALAADLEGWPSMTVSLPAARG